MQKLHEEKILILAKTYPSLSEKYLETVCTAGVREDGSWIRVYPIKFRQMDEVKRYHKYQWISCKVYKPELKNDPRPESFHIEGDIAIVGDVLSTRNSWDERRNAVIRRTKVYTNKKELIDSANDFSSSLALFKPSRLEGPTVEDDEREWNPVRLKRALQNARQLDLFEEEVVPKAADEVFDDFLFTYVSNASFRKQRTKGSESLDMDDDDAVVMIYERENDLELQKDTTLQQVILEKINWDINTLRHYQFSKNQGQWFLSSEQDADISDVPNASFLVFLKDFLTDSLYRHESIDLPLLMKYYSEEDDGMVEAELSFEEWNEIFNDLPRLDDYMYNVDYGQSLISSNRKSLLLKGMSSPKEDGG